MLFHQDSDPQQSGFKKVQQWMGGLFHNKSGAAATPSKKQNVFSDLKMYMDVGFGTSNMDSDESEFDSREKH